MSNIAKKECVEFAMVCAAALIVVGLKADAHIYFLVSLAVLLVALLLPVAFKPFAFLWYGFSRVLGKVMSQLMLLIVYCTILIPISVFRKMFVADALQIKAFRKTKKSVFVQRNGKVMGSELNNPF